MQGSGAGAGKASQCEHLVSPENYRGFLFSWEGLWFILATINSSRQEAVMLTAILNRTAALSSFMLFLLLKYTKAYTSSLT